MSRRTEGGVDIDEVTVARHGAASSYAVHTQVHQVRCCCDHGLEVVQHEQPLLLPQRGFQQLEWRARAGALQPLGLRDGGQDQVGIVNGSERDEADAIGERIPQFGGDGQRQARLAHATCAGQGEQTHLWTCKQGTGGGDLPLSSDKGGERQREGGSRSLDDL